MLSGFLGGGPLTVELGFQVRVGAVERRARHSREGAKALDVALQAVGNGANEEFAHRVRVHQQVHEHRRQPGVPLALSNAVPASLSAPITCPRS